MKTGKRKTQKYMSAILIAAMSMSHVTGVWAEDRKSTRLNSSH